jgi:AraC-like DNA-binding protein
MNCLCINFSVQIKQLYQGTKSKSRITLSTEMSKMESLEVYCKNNLIEESRHRVDKNTLFSVFKRNDFIDPYKLPYCKRDFYKICLIKGPVKFHYSDQSISFTNNFLIFYNPHTPYSCEQVGENHTGYACLFTEDFFNKNNKVKDYPLFKVGEIPAFNITDEQVLELSKIYEKMYDELQSDFVYKFDVIRSLVLELVYHGLKMATIPSSSNDSNGSLRMVTLFKELLDNQFPVEPPKQKIQLRHPTDFAERLAVHVNHLNRSLKELTGKTTSQLIAERILTEARIMLKGTVWNISEIAWCLGFEEPSHFINFFKKRTGLTPNVARKLAS